MSISRTTLAAATFALTPVIAPVAAHAQTEATTKTIELTFTGKIAEGPNSTLQILQPDGTYADYTGPLPPLGFAAGEDMTLSYNIVVPTKAYYDSAEYTGQKAADGLYTIEIVPEGCINCRGDVATFTSPGTKITLVYDANKDSYSVLSDGSFFSSYYSGPGYVYDAATKTYVACDGESCAGSGSEPLFSISGSADGTTITSSKVAVNSTDPNSLAGTGFFTWMLTGSWSLPMFFGQVATSTCCQTTTDTPFNGLTTSGGDTSTTSGGSTEVPEPGVMVLFGFASAGVYLRRRRRKAA